MAILVGATFFTKYFLFLFGVAYVSYGLLRAVLLAIFDVPDDDEPRRRATDYVDPLESYGMTPAASRAVADENGDEMLHDDGSLARRRRRRRHRRPGTPGNPGAPGHGSSSPDE